MRAAAKHDDGGRSDADLEGVEDEDDEVGDEILDRVAEGESCLIAAPVSGQALSAVHSGTMGRYV